MIGVCGTLSSRARDTASDSSLCFLRTKVTVDDDRFKLNSSPFNARGSPLTLPNCQCLPQELRRGALLCSRLSRLVAFPSTTRC